MAQAHLDRLSSIDAGFLHQESGGAHMHIGALAVFDGPAPTDERFREHIASRLPLVPRYRHRIVEMPFGAGRPVWAEDAGFRVEDHVRHAVLPAPGGDEQVLGLVSRLMSQRLDRARPLWETWLVEGLAGDRFAIVVKSHHAMIDGVAGVDLLTALLDLTPDAPPVTAPPWQARPLPGTLALLTHGARGLLRNLVQLGARAASLASDPRRAVREGLGGLAALGAVAAPLLERAPRTVLNRAPGPHRRIELVRTPLEGYKTVKQAFGATVNDVVLAAVTGALGRFLADRGQRVEGLQLRACVPISVRSEADSGAGGNEITVVMAPLPVGATDPVERLALVRRSMEHLKTSRQAQGARVLAALENALPPVLLAHASRLGFSSRMYNLLVTNVPGPQVPLYVLGHRLTELAPLAFLSPDHLLAVAAVSYDGQVTYGLLADADAVPDLADLAGHLEASLAELVDAANARQSASPDRR